MTGSMLDGLQGITPSQKNMLERIALRISIGRDQL